MDQFLDGHHVRLRSRVHGTYLHADGDGHGVSLHGRRSSMKAAWAVHIYQGGAADAQYVLLHSAAYGSYLAATDAPAPRGHRGLRVEQRNYDEGAEEAIRWEAVRFGSGDDVLLRHVTGRCLRANGPGRYLPWNNGVSVDDIDNARTRMLWVVEHISAREGMPPLPRPTGLPLPGGLAAMLPPRVIMYVRTSTEGAGIRRAAFMFHGRSVSRLRNKLARRLRDVMDVSNLAMCVQAGTHGRLTPLVVDLPHSGQDLHIVVFAAGTPVHMELRYPDVDGELVERYHQIHRSESTMDASGEHGIAERGGIISVTGSLGAGPVSTSPTQCADLPVDIIQKIIRNGTLCDVDRVCASLLNRHWRNSIIGVEEMADLANLPWLFLPSSASPCFFNPTKACLHPLGALPEGIRAARPCGSYPGGWLFLDGEASGQDHLLYNLKSGKRVTLPSSVINMEGTIRGETSLLMCALSRSPSCPGYEVATVLNQGSSGEHIIAMWSPQQEHWLEMSKTPEASIVDICYHRGVFLLLTRDEGLIKVIRHANGSRGIQMCNVVRSAGRVMDDLVEKRPQYSLDRRLVESTTGDLLMLIKISRLNRTGTITLYRLGVNHDTGEAEWLNYMSPAGGMGSSR
ncbi:uncharacterized protein LOC125541117 [Triticum urartu]|uniref:uncharacterized protein LOC125541110 n=1 Tax=Triticum urartu TaxID=4572 RepID=UPI0020432704|nr:uncharacterized protein LOC125541110 [Triticum urartu]XP_048560551.1 uncharacterized protein LOC125541117 [Triticum urartu]